MAAPAFWKTRFGVSEWNPSGIGFTAGILTSLILFHGWAKRLAQRTGTGRHRAFGSRATTCRTTLKRSFRLSTLDVNTNGTISTAYSTGIFIAEAFRA
jgi:hypothetical protein